MLNPIDRPSKYTQKINHKIGQAVTREFYIYEILQESYITYVKYSAVLKKNKIESGCTYKLHLQTCLTFE